MKLLILIFLVATSILSYSQNISFSDLLKCRTLEFDKLELFLNQKGFEYYKSTNDDLGQAYHFSYKFEGKIVSYFSDWHYSDGSSYTSFQSQKKAFDKIKNEGLNLGMKYIGKDDTFDKKGYFLKYTYKTYTIEFWVSEGTTNPGVTVYEININ